MSDQPNDQHRLNIELTEKEAQGIYSNLALITHSSAEFIVDFIRIVPGVPKAKVHARILMTSQHAKGLMLALQENIAKYEEQFGEIKMPAHPNTGHFGFPDGNIDPTRN